MACYLALPYSIYIVNSLNKYLHCKFIEEKKVHHPKLRLWDLSASLLDIDILVPQPTNHYGWNQAIGDQIGPLSKPASGCKYFAWYPESLSALLGIQILNRSLPAGLKET